MKAMGTHALAGIITNGLAVMFVLSRAPGLALEATGSIDKAALFAKLLDAVQKSSFGSMLGMLGGREGLARNFQQPFEQKMDEAFREMVTSPHFTHRIQTIRPHLAWLVVWGGAGGAILGLVASFL